MTFLLKQLFSLFHLLNSETGHNQIAAGVACGLILGFAPAFSLQTAIVILALFFFRIQIGAALMSMVGFKLIAYLFDPIENRIGMAVLETDALRPLFTTAYNMPIVPLTRFYNSMVMGSAVVSALLAFPIFMLTQYLVTRYRATVLARFQSTRAWKSMKATKLYGLYAKYQEFYS